MKLKACLTLGVLLLCATFMQTARADETHDTKIKAEMVQNYLLFEIAFKNKDAARMISFESPDYTSVGEDKIVIPKKESDAMWHAVMNATHTVYEVNAEIKKLTIEPHRVVVLTRQYDDSLRKWSGEKLQRVSISAMVRDTWVNYDGVWMLKRSEDLSSEIVVDGKPER
jgi:hypothetical protein